MFELGIERLWRDRPRGKPIEPIRGGRAQEAKGGANAINLERVRVARAPERIGVRLPKPEYATSLSHYPIKKILGEGGFGAVSLATDIDTKEPIALKRSADLEAAALEAKVMQAYDAHPSRALGRNYLIKYRSHFVQQKQAYIAMEFTKGTALDAAAHRGMSDKLKVETIINAARALSYLHGAGWLHCDMKPANIVMVPGQPKTLRVIDFGLAAKMGRDKRYTGPLGGTEGYWAPEHNDDVATPSSDVFSLGGTLYFLLTGNDPSENNNYQRIKSAGLRRIVQKAMETDPAKRYPSMQAMITALRPYDK